MFGKKSNFINGDWVEGEGEIININPSDTNDIIEYVNQSNKKKKKKFNFWKLLEND